MKLYHGSLEIVEKPKILPRKNGHTCDFGIGFYTTTSYEQASRWVSIRKKSNPNAKGYANNFEVSDDLLKMPNLKVLRFATANYDGSYTKQFEKSSACERGSRYYKDKTITKNFPKRSVFAVFYLDNLQAT